GVRSFPTPPLRIMGTGPYLPPELAYDRKPDERGDLYAAGVVLFECVAGGLPLWHVRTDAYHAYVARHGFPSLSKIGVKVSPELERVVRRATMASPDARYQTAEAFAFDLFDAVPPSELTDYRPPAAPAPPAPRAQPALAAPPAPRAQPVLLAPSAPRAQPVLPAPLALLAPPAARARPALAAPSALPARPVPPAPSAPAPAMPTLVARRPARPAVLSNTAWRALPLAVASLASGVAATLAVTLATTWWSDPPAQTVRVVAEPRVPARPHARTGAAPDPPAPQAPPPADARPPSAPATATATARAPSASASASKGGARRAQLEAKLQTGTATAEEARQLAGLCRDAGDQACWQRALAAERALRGER
ncbi:MAG TPA: hypothetical protein VFS00_15910, partial [Polyangiaceae bacterium]|nr:hypothetical protein [Polyangiaceae bacterium]